VSLYVAVNTTERRAVRRRYAPKESLHALWLKNYEPAFQMKPRNLSNRALKSGSQIGCWQHGGMGIMNRRVGGVGDTAWSFDACYMSPRMGDAGG
jgi:hypothetical protein